MRILIHSIIAFILMTLIIQVVIANGLPPSRHVIYYGKQASPKQVVITHGSLKANIERIARQYGWNKVIWNSPNDYRWVSYTKLRRSCLQGVLQIILVDYPLQAIFYKGNHVLEIQPRTVR